MPMPAEFTKNILQFTFQAVLVTDGTASFAIFNYVQPATLEFIRPHQIGFNAGDRIRVSNVQTDSIDATSVFRIDGMPEGYISWLAS